MSARIEAEDLRWGIIPYKAVTEVQDGILHRHLSIRRELPWSQKKLLADFVILSNPRNTHICFTKLIIPGPKEVNLNPETPSYSVPGTHCTIFHGEKDRINMRKR